MKRFRSWGIRSRLAVLVLLAVVPLFLIGLGTTVSLVLSEGREARLKTLSEKPDHICGPA